MVPLTRGSQGGLPGGGKGNEGLSEVLHCQRTGQSTGKARPCGFQALERMSDGVLRKGHSKFECVPRECCVNERMNELNEMVSEHHLHCVPREFVVLSSFVHLPNPPSQPHLAGDSL